MKKLKKIKLNIEKDIISSISKEDQIEIKGGAGPYFGSDDCAPNGTRNCTLGDCGGPTNSCNCTKPTEKACISPGTNSCHCGTAACVSNNCYTNNYTDRCIPTGSAESQEMQYNCYTYHTLCNC